MFPPQDPATAVARNYTLSRSDFCRLAPVAALSGVVIAALICWALYGTPFLFSNPAVLRGDPFPYFLHLILPLGLLMPLIIRRFRDRGRSPISLALIGGVLFGFMLFSSHLLPSQRAHTMDAFIAQNVIFAPLVIAVLWIIYECCFLGSKRQQKALDAAIAAKPEPKAANSNVPAPNPAN